MHTGSCLCKSVSYTYDEVSAGMAMHCHCRDCQAVTGSGKATVVMFPAAAVNIEGPLKTFASRGTDGSHVNRGFCPECGSQLFTFVDEIPDTVFIKAGTMHESSWVKPAMNCWAASAVDWMPADESIPGSPGNPDL